MGRKRASFAEGIAEEDQRYAQVLRDIRDLRGETQQGLGRLLGWSVSTVSRFEAGTERPDEATHRRYCALAPTEELRQRLMAALDPEVLYGAACGETTWNCSTPSPATRPPSRPPRTSAPPARSKTPAWRWRW